MLKLFIGLGLFFIALWLNFDIDDSFVAILVILFIQHYLTLRQRLLRAEQQLKQFTIVHKKASQNKHDDNKHTLPSKIPLKSNLLKKQLLNFLYFSWSNKDTTKTVPPKNQPAIKPPSPHSLKLSLQNIKHHYLDLWLPFLWQNLAWFIGALCLLGGSIFLMIYSQGFIKSFVLLGSLSIYSAALFLIAIRLAKKSGYDTLVQILFMLGLGFVPLVFASLSRLWLHVAGINIIFLSAALSLLLIGGFSLATQIAFSHLNRHFYPHFAWLFLGLSALQLCVPLLSTQTQLPFLFGLHGLLLSLLFIFIWRFSQHDLPRLFVEQKPQAWFAVASLLYASLVSFIHLSLTPVRLPSGYFGVFIMGIAALCLYSDWHIQKWVRGHVWLGRVALLVYAGATLALWAALTGDVLWLSLTAATGVLLFSTMLWFYLTPAAFYALMAFISLLYSILVLRHFPHGWHFMLSLPLFLGVFWLFRRLLYRRLTNLDSRPHLLVAVQYSLFALISVTTLWSLIRAFPGWLPMLTPLSAALLLLHIGAYQVLNIPHNLSSGLRACYLSVLFAILTLAYIPLFLPSWSLQFAWLLLLFAALCLAWGYYALRQWRDTLPCRCHPSVFFHSVVFALSLALLGVLYSNNSLHSVFIFANAALLALVLAWLLRIRWLLIPVLLLASFALWQLKLYTGYVASGSGLFWGVLLLWLLSFWLNHYYQFQRPKVESIYPDEPVFARWRINPAAYINPAHWLVPLLLPAAVLLWDLGLLNAAFLAFQGHRADTQTYFVIGLSSLVLALELARWRWFLPIMLAALATAAALGLSSSLALAPALGFVICLLLLLLLSPWRWAWLQTLAAHFYWCSKPSPVVERLVYFNVLLLVSVASLSQFLQPVIFAWLLLCWYLYLWMLIFYRRWRHFALLYLSVAVLVLESYVLYGLLSAVPYWQISAFNTLSLGLAWVLVWSVVLPFLPHSRMRKVAYIITIRALPLLLCGLLGFVTAYTVPVWQVIFLLLLSVLALWLLPIAKASVRAMSWVRGIGIPLLLSIAVLLYLAPLITLTSQWLLVLWGFILAAVAKRLKPLENYFIATCPSKSLQNFDCLSFCHYPIVSSPWRWLGLLSLTVALLQAVFIDTLPFTWQQLGLALALVLYLALLFPFFKQAWLRHVLVILLLSCALLALTWFENTHLLLIMLFVGLNAAFALSWWRLVLLSTDGRYLIDLFRQYSAALLSMGFVLLWVFVSFYSVWLHELDWYLWGLLIACFVSFLHWCAVLSCHRSNWALAECLNHHSLAINFLLWSSLSMLWVLLYPLLSLFWIALASLLFLWLLLLLSQQFIKQYSLTLFLQWLRLWLWGAVLVSLLLLNPQQDWQLVALAMLSSGVFVSLSALGQLWHGAASLSVTVLVHVLWLPWVVDLPWFFWALQDTLLWSLGWGQRWRIHFVLLQLPIVARLSWGLGFVSVVYGLDLSIAALLVAFISAYLLARQTVTKLGIYPKIIWVILALLLGRFYILAWAMPSLLDTIALLLLASLLSIWQQQFAEESSDYKQLYGLILATIALTCISLLGQMQPLQSSLSLFASASLLLFLPQRRPLSLYFAMLLLNVAVYIWLPDWITKTHLLQLYLMPAAITLLLFVQLQQNLLSVDRSHQLRLLALAALYSAAMVDFFQQPGILVFSLALGLSLGGIVVGLAFKIRAFLYTGLVFLLVFIISQLLQYYPEDSLFKGLILMGLGLLITGSTFIFQLKHLILLKQWQRWQNHLKYWQ